MKDILILFILSLLPIVLTLCSFYLLLNGIKGWGWFLFGAFCFGITKFKQDKID